MPSDDIITATRLPAPPTRFDRAIALFLDLDGVLAPLAATPDAVVPDARRTRLLSRLEAALDGRIAIVSGRTIAEIDRIAGGEAIAAAGIHGLERRRRGGRVERVAASPAVATAVEAFRAFAAARPGVIVEDKVMAAGLHYRQSPDSAADATALAEAVGRETGLTLQPGHMVLELKTPGTDKGRAVSAFMSEPPFAGALPVMVGDDLTDEAGFVAASGLGGFGVLVGEHRPTAARHGLADVPAVLTWLEAVSDGAPQ